MAGIASAIALLLAVAAESGETPAEPVFHSAPAYPTVCMPAPGKTQPVQSVTIAFGVSKDGLPEKVRVVETTDPCFNDAAVAAVRGWKYKPRKVNGHPQPQEGLEATFNFIFQEPTEVVESEATPSFRLPPRYPERCARAADRSESVVVEFDVTLEGTTDNIRVLESTSSCFEKSASEAVAKWKYNPKIVGGKPAVRKGVQTTITYELAGGGASRVPPDLEFRMGLRSKLLRVQRMLKKDADPQEALDDLAAIEAEYGSTFTRAELAAFHQVRAAARIEAKDYRGALDDLRVCQRLALTGDATEAVAETIVQLEAIVAAEEKPAASSEAPASAPPPDEPVEGAAPDPH